MTRVTPSMSFCSIVASISAISCAPSSEAPAVSESQRVIERAAAIGADDLAGLLEGNGRLGYRVEMENAR